MLMARKAYILFPNEANHSGGFAPHSLNPLPYATASGSTYKHVHITVTVCSVMSDTYTKHNSEHWRSNVTQHRILFKQGAFLSALFFK